MNLHFNPPFIYCSSLYFLGFIVFPWPSLLLSLNIPSRSFSFLWMFDNRSQSLLSSAIIFIIIRLFPFLREYCLGASIMRNGTCGCVPEIYAQIDERNIENRFGAYFVFFLFHNEIGAWNIFKSNWTCDEIIICELSSSDNLEMYTHLHRNVNGANYRLALWRGVCRGGPVHNRQLTFHDHTRKHDDDWFHLRT